MQSLTSGIPLSRSPHYRRQTGNRVAGRCSPARVKIPDRGIACLTALAGADAARPPGKATLCAPMVSSDMTVELRELPSTTVLCGRCSSSTPSRPSKQDFAAPAVESLALSDQDPDWLSVAIVVDGVPVGMFVLDLRGYVRDLDDGPSTVLFRAFHIAPEHQGNRSATEVVSATRAHV